MQFSNIALLLIFRENILVISVSVREPLLLDGIETNVERGRANAVAAIRQKPQII